MLSPSVYKGFYTILLCLHPSELQLWDTFANLFLTSAEDFKHQSALAEGLIVLVNLLQLPQYISKEECLNLTI